MQLLFVSHRLIRVASIWRRSQGNPFRILDKISDLRREFSFSARRIAMAAFAELVAVHWLACTLWWTLRLQGYPQSRHTGSLALTYIGFFLYYIQFSPHVSICCVLTKCPDRILQYCVWYKSHFSFLTDA